MPRVATPLLAPLSVVAIKSDVLLFAAEPKVRCAKTSVPITRPKLVLAPAAVVAPVPPLAIATAPVILFAATSAILALVIAPFAIVGSAAVPVKSPVN